MAAGTNHTCASDVAETCLSSLGCAWVQECVGTPHGCDSLAEEACVEDAPCAWGGGACEPVPAECERITSPDACATRLGCTWEADLVCFARGGCAAHTAPDCPLGCVPGC